MNIEVVLGNKTNSYLIKNIYPLYLHDLSEIYNILPNEYGIFEEEPIKTLAEQYDCENENIWFEKPDILYPFIIMVDGRPAGFDLVTTKQYAPKEYDYYVHEFFLLRPYRGNNIATIAAHTVFDKFKGKWGLYVAPNGMNPRGEKFWRRTVTEYTQGNYEETQGMTFDDEKIIFSFDNSNKNI